MEQSEDRQDLDGKAQVEHPSDIMSEAAFYYYRGLLGQIEIALPGHPSRVLLFSGSSPGEGATETVVGLSLTLAAGMGRKTAVIDCNGSHPDLHRRFGTHEIGLGEYLRGELTLERALVNTTVPRLHIMPLGRRFQTLAAYRKEDLRELISKLREKFEYVLIDSAPVGVNPESTILCDKVDAVILVVHHGRTRREVVRRTKEIIERAGGQVLGAVLNKRKFPIPEFLYRRL